MKKRIISAILLVLVAFVGIIPVMSLNAEAADTTITFEFGVNGSATHKDGSSSKNTYEETVDGYTLNITGGTNMYPSSYDAKGNSALKLGSSKNAGSFSFTVPSDVTSVVIYAAKYKTNTSKLTVNGTTYTLTKNSNDGAYDEITVDTSSTKTVSVATASGGIRAMINAIDFIVETAEAECTHTNTTTTTVDATCTTEGSVTVTCDNCKEVLSTETLSTIDHTYVNGTCTECGETQVLGTTTLNIVIADYADANNWADATQYTTVTEDNITITASGTTNTGKYYENGENWRLYQNESATVTFAANGNYTIISVKVTYSVEKTGVLQMNSENISSGTVIDVNATSITLSVGNTSSATNGQVRITEMEIVYKQSDCNHAYEESVTPPTCTEKGYTTHTCSKCSDSYTNNETPALGHTWGDGVVTTEPGKLDEGVMTFTCSVCQGTKTEAIPAKGYTATFAVPGGVTAPANKSGLYINLPDSVTKSYSEGGIEYTFVGWSTVKFENETVPAFSTPNSRVELTEDTVFYAVYSWTVGGGSSSGDYVLTDISNISANDKVVIVFTHSNGTTYAVSNDKGTDAAPNAIAVTINGNKLSADPADNLIWNISNSSGNLTIYPNGTTAKWLYCTAANNGVRVGTNANKIFTLDSTTGYLKHTATSRYLGIYSTTPDLRCYTSHTTANIKNQSVAFYVQESGSTVNYKTIGCLHENTSNEIIGNCGESGVRVTTCTDCGYVTEKEIAKIDHDYSIIEVIAPTCTSGGYTLHTCSRCDSTYRSNISDALTHNFDSNGVCHDCGAFNPAAFDLSGMYYFSTARTDGVYWYMSSLINIGSDGKTLRYSAINSGLTTLPGSITSPDLTSIFVLERITEGEDAGKYLIYAYGIVGEEKYIGWTEGNSATFVSRENAKRLTLENVLGEKSFTFSFTEGEDTMYLSLNNNYDYFAFYKGTQTQNLSLIPIEFPEEDVNEFTGVSLNLGADLTIRYHVNPDLNNSLDDYTVRFTMNGKSVTVSGVAEGAKLVFSFKGIAPQLMGHTITAELMLNGEKIYTKDSYSVKQYVIDALALYPDYTELKALLSDILYYGAQAQKYLNPNIADEDLVTYGVDGLSFSDSDFEGFEPTRSIVTEDGADTTLANFTAAGVRFDYINQIFVKFTTENVENVKIMVGSTELEIISLGDNKYVAYSAGISALKFGETVSFKLIYDSNLIQTLTYAVNDYAYSKNAKPDNTTDLALALYRYGISAKAYDDSKSTNP